MKTKVDGNQGHADGQSKKKSGRVELFNGVPNSSFMTKKNSLELICLCTSCTILS